MECKSNPKMKQKKLQVLGDQKHMDFNFLLSLFQVTIHFSFLS